MTAGVPTLNTARAALRRGPVTLPGSLPGGTEMMSSPPGAAAPAAAD
jgi:hypothetical protein